MSTISTVDLALAIYYEHRQRTGHDCLKANLTTREGMWMQGQCIVCEVCQHLRIIMDKAEKESQPPEPEVPIEAAKTA